MTRDAAIFLALVIVGAGWLLVHLLLLLRIARARQVGWPLRLLAVLPPATPIVGFVARARGLSLLWALQGLGYLVLRSLS